MSPARPLSRAGDENGLTGCPRPDVGPTSRRVWLHSVPSTVPCPAWKISLSLSSNTDCPSHITFTEAPTSTSPKQPAPHTHHRAVPPLSFDKDHIMPRIMLDDDKASSHSFTANNEPSPSVEVKPLASPSSSPPRKKASQNGGKRGQASASPSSAKKPKKDSVEDNGSWTLDKRAGFLEDVPVAGYKSADFDALATKVRGAPTGRGVFAPSHDG